MKPPCAILSTWQIESGIDFLVPCGTTGETPTLSHDEWLRVIEITVEVAAGRVPIVAGATSNSTHEAVAKGEGGRGASRAWMRFLPRRRTTTSRRRKASTGISAPSPRPSTSRSCSTTSPAARREHRTGHAGAAG